MVRRDRKLTRQQRALVALIRAGRGQDAYDLLGENHPTVKWWRRLFRCHPASCIAHAAIQHLRERD